MSDPPPPGLPPAGWYPDPAGGAGARWWDGSSWSDEFAPAGSAGEPALGPMPGSAPSGAEVRPWLRESLRLVVARAGHLLPFLLFFVLVPGLLSATALWFGARDTVLTLDPGQVWPDVSYGGAWPALIAAGVALPLSMVAATVAKAAVAHQIWAARADQPIDWSVSLAAVGDRWRPLVGAATVRTGLYWALAAGFMAASMAQPAFVLLFPVVLAATLLLLARLGFLAQAAVLGPAGTRPLATSFRITRHRPWWVLGRLVILGLVALQFVLLARLVGALVAELAGAAEAPPIDPGERVIETNALFGSDLALFLLGSAFGALGIGASHAVAAAGTTLLYRLLDGPAQLVSLPEESTPAVRSGLEPR